MRRQGPQRSTDAAVNYTSRTRSIACKDEPFVRAATAALVRLLEPDLPVLQLRLGPGMGIMCDNVWNDRAAFADSAVHRRLILRGRYYEPVTAADTTVNDARAPQA